MRKYITLFAFVCFLFAGLQTSNAQNTPEVRAKSKTESLHKLVDLNKKQMKQVYEVYLAQEKGQEINDTPESSDVMKHIQAILLPKQQAKLEKHRAREAREAVRQKKINSQQG